MLDEEGLEMVGHAGFGEHGGNCGPGQGILGENVASPAEILVSETADCFAPLICVGGDVQIDEEFGGFGRGGGAV